MPGSVSLAFLDRVVVRAFCDAIAAALRVPCQKGAHKRRVPQTPITRTNRVGVLREGGAMPSRWAGRYNISLVSCTSLCCPQNRLLSVSLLCECATCAACLAPPSPCTPPRSAQTSPWRQCASNERLAARPHDTRPPACSFIGVPNQAERARGGKLKVNIVIIIHEIAGTGADGLGARPAQANCFSSNSD